MSTSAATCPACGQLAHKDRDGKLIPHQRYADGAGYGPDQPHDHVWCEGAPRPEGEQ